MINPHRDTWVVCSSEFIFRGCKMEKGSDFRPRLLHPRAWNNYIRDGFICKKVDYVEEPEAVPEKVIVEEQPKVEIKEEEPVAKPKKPTIAKKKPAKKKVKKDA